MVRLAEVEAVEIVWGKLVFKLMTESVYLVVFLDAFHLKVTWDEVSLISIPVVHSEFSSGKTKAAPSGAGGGPSSPPQETNNAKRLK